MVGSRFGSSSLAVRPVVDQTGLAGRYDFGLVYRPDQSRTGGGRGDNSPPPSDQDALEDGFRGTLGISVNVHAKSRFGLPKFRSLLAFGAAGLASLEAVVNALNKALPPPWPIFSNIVWKGSGNTAKLTGDIACRYRPSPITNGRRFICSHPKGQSIQTRRIGGTWRPFTLRDGCDR
jgi:hypothetical protein